MMGGEFERSYWVLLRWATIEQEKKMGVGRRVEYCGSVNVSEGKENARRQRNMQGGG